MLSPVPRRSGWAYYFAQSPSRISLPRKGRRVGLRIVLRGQIGTDPSPTSVVGGTKGGNPNLEISQLALSRSFLCYKGLNLDGLHGERAH